MKQLLYTVLITLLLFYGCGSDVSGTATDVNSGSLSGIIENEGTPYKESMDIYIRDHASGNIVSHLETNSGSYQFDSLQHGSYDIVASIMDNSVTLGYEENIDVAKGTTAHIAVGRIVRKSFQLRSNDGQDLKVSPISISNFSTEELSKNIFRLTFLESDDSISFPIHYTLNKESDSIRATLTRGSGLAYTVQINQRLPISVVNLETSILTGSGSDSSTIIIEGTIE